MSELEPATGLPFTTEMVRAYVAGTKRVTRRVVSPPNKRHRWRLETTHLRGDVDQPEGRAGNRVWATCLDPEDGKRPEHRTAASRDRVVRCRYGNPGRLLYTRETFSATVDTSDLADVPGANAWWGDVPKEHRQPERIIGGPIYRADVGDAQAKGIRWTPPMFQPRALARYHLRLLDRWAEPVSAITDADVALEGLVDLPGTVAGHVYAPSALCWLPGGHAAAQDGIEPGPRAAFAELWDRINARRGYPWHLDPLVWRLHLSGPEGLPTR